MTEKDIFKKLKEQTKLSLSVFSIETGVTELGVPDVYYDSLFGFEGWLELKVAKNRLEGAFLEYRPGQQQWLKRHKNYGLTCYTLFYFKDNYYLTNEFKDFFTGRELTENTLWKGKTFLEDKFLICLRGIK